MGLNREDKAAVIEEVSGLVSGAGSVVIAEYRGLSVEAVTVLRKNARDNGVQMRVLKNTLVRRALAGTPFEGLSDRCVGPLIYGFSADPVAPARVVCEFAKKNNAFVVKGGAMPGSVLDAAGIEALSKMPSREELLATLMATMNAPVQKLVRTINEVPARLVRTLAAVRDAKEASA
ncbi:MAG TPA: 50S ribosomal protein L10 [Sutterella sp.]|nr:50S ribosomal protein L10 [Sutterella sp.]